MTRRQLDEVMSATSAALEDLDLTSARGSLEWLIPTYSVLNDGLTLKGLIDPELHDRVVTVKNLYLLWNTTVDDAIDRHGDLRELDDSVLQMFAAPRTASSPAGALMDRLLTLTRALNGDMMALTVALWEVMAAMRYEHACRSQPALLEPERFCRHAVGTFSLEVHLALDLLAAPTTLEPRRAVMVGRVYREISAALRYANDLGGLEREHGEGAVNVIAVWHLADPSGDPSTLITRARDATDAHVARARALAMTADIPGLENVVSTGVAIVEAFKQGDPFGDPRLLSTLDLAVQAGAA